MLWQNSVASRWVVTKILPTSLMFEIFYTKNIKRNIKNIKVIIKINKQSKIPNNLA